MNITCLHTFIQNTKLIKNLMIIVLTISYINSRSYSTCIYNNILVKLTNRFLQWSIKIKTIIYIMSTQLQSLTIHLYPSILALKDV